MTEPSKSLAAIVAELRALGEAAKPGEWFYDSYARVWAAPLRCPVCGDITDTCEHEEADDPVCYVPIVSGDTATKQGAHDAELIAAMKLHLPALLDAAERVEKAEARVSELEAALDRYGEHDHECAILQPGYPPCTCGLDAVSRGEGA